jgi:glutamate-1-semialdehyde 2,1-aminomutase
MPIGDCQHSGTYNGHPVPVAAGLAAITAYREPGFYEHIHAVARELYEGLNAVFARHGIAAHVQGLGARFGIYFGTPDRVTNYRDAVQHQRATMLRFIASAIRHGVYFHDYGGAACHHGFCAAMSLADVKEALDRLEKVARDSVVD